LQSGGDSCLTFKEFEGYYRLEGKNDTYVRISATKEGLTLRQIWDNVEIPLQQTSPLKFNDASKSFVIEFVRSTNGSIVHFIAFSRDIWIRDDNYREAPTTNTQLTLQDLREFEGLYKREGQEVYLTLAVSGRSIVITENWSGKKIVIISTANNTFSENGRSFPLRLVKNTDGTVREIVVFFTDVWQKVSNRPNTKKSFHLTMDELRSFDEKSELK
jgi:hypothetical protein